MLGAVSNCANGRNLEARRLLRQWLKCHIAEHLQLGHSAATNRDTSAIDWLTEFCTVPLCSACYYAKRNAM
jgi:hypothetical protein